MNQRCIQCGAEIMPGFQFCMNCGAAVYPIAPEPVQEQSESSVVPNQAHEAMPPVAAPAPIEMSQYPPVPNQFVPVMDPNQPVMNQYPPIPNQNTPVMDPNQSAMNQYPMQGTMPTKTKKPKNPEVMTRAANAGLAVVLSLSLLFTTLTVFVSFRKDIS